MAIYYYAEGEHPTGYVGWRVAVSMGRNDSLKQVYYSANEYSYNKGKELAEKTDKELRLIAEANKIKCGVPTGRDGRTISLSFTRGFSFSVTKPSKGSIGWSIGFKVQVSSEGKRVFRRFNLKGGLSEAYLEALDYYAEMKGISDMEYDTLHMSEPTVGELLDYINDYLPLIYEDIPHHELSKRLLSYVE